MPLSDRPTSAAREETLIQTAPSEAQPVMRLKAHLLEGYRGPIAVESTQAARQARWRALPDDLAPSLADALRAGGRARLYIHQREPRDLARAKRPFAVATPTASHEVGHGVKNPYWRALWPTGSRGFQTRRVALAWRAPGRERLL